MKKRHVFSSGNLATAQRCVLAARESGIGSDDLSIIAAQHIELQPLPDYVQQAIPDHLKPSSPTDFVPGLVRGAAGGGGAGLLAGVVAMAVPPLGVTLGGAALLGLAGGVVGAWVGSLVGAALPNEVDRRFKDRLDAGDVLIVVDVDEEQLPALDTRMQLAGATKLDYEQATVLT